MIGVKCDDVTSITVPEDGGQKCVLFDPDVSKVNQLLDALKARAVLATEDTAPCWLVDDPAAPADELIACENGLFHVPERRLLPHTPTFFNVNWAVLGC